MLKIGWTLSLGMHQPKALSPLVFNVNHGSSDHGGTDTSTDSTPVLWAHALFTTGDQTVTGGDVLRVTYLVSAASV